jgi:hypothetical protein
MKDMCGRENVADAEKTPGMLIGNIRAGELLLSPALYWSDLSEIHELYGSDR